MPGKEKNEDKAMTITSQHDLNKMSCSARPFLSHKSLGRLKYEREPFKKFEFESDNSSSLLLYDCL
jgi:hypothetical protein